MQAEPAEIPTALPQTSLGAIKGKWQMDKPESKILAFYKKNRTENELSKFIDDATLEILQKAPGAFNDLNKLFNGDEKTMIVVMEALLVFRFADEGIKALDDRFKTSKIKEDARKEKWSFYDQVRQKAYKDIEHAKNVFPNIDVNKHKIKVDRDIKALKVGTEQAKKPGNEFKDHIVQIYILSKEKMPKVTEPNAIHVFMADLFKSLRIFNTVGTPYTRQNISKIIKENLQ